MLLLKSMSYHGEILGKYPQYDTPNTFFLSGDSCILLSTMIQRINKKLLFRFSVLVSAVVAILFTTSRKSGQEMLQLITEVPLSSIERVSADGGSGDCSCSADGSTWDPGVVTESAMYMTVKKYVPAAPSWSVSCSWSGGGGCFIAGTMVLMEDGTLKDIREIQSGEMITSSQGGEMVMKKYEIPYSGDLYAFNGSGNFFVTPTHPFMTTDGWKSLDPEGTKKETPDLDVSLLQVGDTLLQKEDKQVVLEKLDVIQAETTVYNFGLNGSHDFFADNYLVHNVNLGDFVEKAEAVVMIK